jgi:lysozyme family protein
MSEDFFDVALEHILRFEGGYVDHPLDPGGATNFGITRRTLAKWRGVQPFWKLPKTEVKNLSKKEVRAIYRARYWQPAGAHKLPPAIGLVVFDFAVHSGPRTAVKKLQQIIGVTIDGRVGPETLGAVDRFVERHGHEKLATIYIAHRHKFLKSLSAYKTFGPGWTNRLKHLKRVVREQFKFTKKMKDYKKMPMLDGYKTYIVALFMLLAGLLEIAGINLPAIATENAGQLIMEALAILFLRKGIKQMPAKA